MNRIDAHNSNNNNNTYCPDCAPSSVWGSHQFESLAGWRVFILQQKPKEGQMLVHLNP